MQDVPLSIVQSTDEYRAWARRLLQERWKSTRVVTRGQLHHADFLPAFVALLAGAPTGLITYRIAEGECEIVTLDSLRERRGIGTSLLNAVHEVAKETGCGRVWLITTNDNLEALQFYRNRGFGMVAVHYGAVDHSRKLKPEIPRLGRHGIPIRDEIELEILL